MGPTDTLLLYTQGTETLVRLREPVALTARKRLGDADFVFAGAIATISRVEWASGLITHNAAPQATYGEV